MFFLSQRALENFAGCQKSFPEPDLIFGLENYYATLRAVIYPITHNGQKYKNGHPDIPDKSRLRNPRGFCSNDIIAEYFKKSNQKIWIYCKISAILNRNLIKNGFFARKTVFFCFLQGWFFYDSICFAATVRRW
jgi:hypothetical protein